MIVPARNEASSIGDCLRSLVDQSEPGFALGQQWELIVIDDDSTDGTRAIVEEIAAGLAGVTVMSAPPLDLGPRGGFTGKSNACWSGAQRARGEWLLFTDADTVHRPGDLSRSIREAERHKLSLLSYSPHQVTTTFWQQAVMPLVYSELASVYPPEKIADPESRVAAANGQYLLVERDAYFSVGGHRAVGPNVLEDVALARNIKKGRRAIRLRYAPEALSTRMYRTTGEMIEGWTKNLALLMPSPVSLAMWRLLDFALFFGLPALAYVLPPRFPAQWAVFLLLWVRTCFRFYNRVMRAHFPLFETVISILGIPLFVYLLLSSVVHHRILKKVSWKGRSYSTGR